MVILHPLNLGERTLLQRDAARSKDQQLVLCTAPPKRHSERDTAKRRAGSSDILRHETAFVWCVREEWLEERALACATGS